ncbi:hypothetical protein [Streptomyces sp. NBC_00006]|uniref:hypothetical protein n=1 Tax=Streptomyces sp. NBC_00006 TaxID=2975619 RepID=UPI002B1DDD90|nr:hypothetical protein [Streptomyces sp. NBC_00006]
MRRSPPAAAARPARHRNRTTGQGTLDVLLPTGQGSDVYADMVRKSGRGALLRYYRIEDGTHVDSLVDTFPGKLRPIVPCHRAAFEAMEEWVAGKGRPPAGHTVRRPADANTETLLTSCPLE